MFFEKEKQKQSRIPVGLGEYCNCNCTCIVYAFGDDMSSEEEAGLALSPPPSSLSEPRPSSCFSCKGSGRRAKRVRASEVVGPAHESSTETDGIIEEAGEGAPGLGAKQPRSRKWVREEQECKACQGRGFLQRSRLGKTKKVRKSYPSFVAPGPLPVGDRGRPELQVRDNEELCYLTGNWRIFQEIERHRYSTDDLVTSWLACREARRLGLGDNPLMLDIGCGIGSVLLSNAWQFPGATCIGLEAQPDRYKQACRSISYNVGSFPDEQKRVQCFQGDMRDGCAAITDQFPGGFSVVTGTPPYFDVKQAVLPGCMESAGCLFELRGGVETYCEAASRYLRRRREGEEGGRPSVFVMVNTSLTSSRVYIACRDLGMSVVHRLDVLPVPSKPALFSVFVIVLDEWVDAFPDLFPRLQTEFCAPLPDVKTGAAAARTIGSVRGELVSVMCVRGESREHTAEYASLLRDLGKPSSMDRETYDPSLLLMLQPPPVPPPMVPSI